MPCSGCRPFARFQVCWFAGIFYLPDLRLPHRLTTPRPKPLWPVARKLFRFVTPFMVLTVIFGLWRLSYQMDYYLSAPWMQLKMTGVIFLIGYHLQYGVYTGRIQRGEDNKSHVFYNVFNEAPCWPCSPSLGWLPAPVLMQVFLHRLSPGYFAICRSI